MSNRDGIERRVTQIEVPRAGILTAAAPALITRIRMMTRTAGAVQTKARNNGQSFTFHHPRPRPFSHLSVIMTVIDFDPLATHPAQGPRRLSLNPR